MGAKTKIEWTDSTWGPVSGCTKISPGCVNCYAETIAERFRGSKGYPEGFDLTLKPHKLEEPLRWRKGRRVFVNSMSDLFHEGLEFEYIAACFGVMARSSRHTYQILTKRIERALEFFEWLEGRAVAVGDLFPNDDRDWRREHVLRAAAQRQGVSPKLLGMGKPGATTPAPWPLPNVWLGISAENEKYLEERGLLLARAPAALRFLSLEPLLGPISEDSLGSFLDPGGYCCGGEMGCIAGCWAASYPRDEETGQYASIDWVIVGGESGDNARPMHPDWPSTIQYQCEFSQVPYFFKQWGEWKEWAPGDRGVVRHVSARDGKHGPNPGYVDGERAVRADTRPMAKVGKKAAGCVLDGKTHKEFPREVA